MSCVSHCSIPMFQCTSHCSIPMSQCISHCSIPMPRCLSHCSIPMHSPQVEREKLEAQEASLRLSAEQGRLHRSLRAAQQELVEVQQRVRMLQVGAMQWGLPTRLGWSPRPHLCLAAVWEWGLILA